MAELGISDCWSRTATIAAFKTSGRVPGVSGLEKERHSSVVERRLPCVALNTDSDPNTAYLRGVLAG